MAITTQGAILKIKGAEENAFTDVTIKSFPDMGSAPNMIECTTLSDGVQKFVEVVKPMAAMEFTANYDKTVYENLKNKEGMEMTYQLCFGDNGTFQWTGTHAVIVSAGGINAVVDMKISVLPDSVITIANA